VRDSIHPARLARSWRGLPLAAALPLGAVLVAGCTGSPSPARPAATGTSETATSAAAASGCGSPPSVSCYTPYQFMVAYGIQPLLDKGTDGRGETVTILVPAAPPGARPPSTRVYTNGATPPVTATDLRQNLAAFDNEFHLPAASVQPVTSLAGTSSPWQATIEEVQDVEIVHAVAPAAAIRVVLLADSGLGTPKDATASMIAGLRLAVSGTDVAMIDLSLGEHFFTRAQAAQVNTILLGAEAQHVTVVAGSGDNGGFSETTFGGTPVPEVSLPASDPLVLSVGGTALTANPMTGAYESETVWNGETGSASVTLGASGGGFSHLYARPSYEDGVPRVAAMRGVPDVAADAYQSLGIAIVDVVHGQTQTSSSGGTGAAASLWAGLMALADQYAHRDLGFVNPAIYRIARGASYHQAFHDITTGSTIQTMPYPGGTAGYQAGPGWSPATGWGTPDAQALIPLLAA
jgi:subtilase family serine protease